jgi:DNA-binding transcriptional MocR family regulator
MWVLSCHIYLFVFYITNTANLQASSIAQAITLKLLTSWGYEGFFKHTHAVSQFYKEKRDIFERMLHKHLEGLAEWSSPEAGMFVWYVITMCFALSQLTIDVLPGSNSF